MIPCATVPCTNLPANPVKCLKFAAMIAAYWTGQQEDWCVTENLLM